MGGGCGQAMGARARSIRVSCCSIRPRAASMELRTSASCESEASRPWSRSHRRWRSISRMASPTGSSPRSPAMASISALAVRSRASSASAASSTARTARSRGVGRRRHRARAAAAAAMARSRRSRESGTAHRSRQGRLQSERFQPPSPNPREDRGLGLTGPASARSILRLMSANLPEMLDAWRMVTARRGVEGRLPLSALTRLRDSLLDTEGEVRFALDFDRDELQVPYVELRIEAGLPLECQRSLERFLLPVNIVQRLGLIRDEADEAALPPGYEPLLVPEDGMLRPSELVEDELILAIPVVPMAPGTDAMERDWPAEQAEQERANPFAALAALKHKK